MSQFTLLLRSLFLIIFLFSFHLLQAYSIVFVHIGPSIPLYLKTTIAQARLFNSDCEIYVIANQSAIDKFQDFESNVQFIPCESLNLTATHEKFHNNSGHDWGTHGFWVYTSERFFYLEEFVRQYDLKDVFHLENDIMLYVNLNTILPIFKKYYNGMIGATFENDDRCVPGILYISEPAPLTKLIDFFPKNVSIKQTDMETIAIFKNEFHNVFIDYLPIILPEYSKQYRLRHFTKKTKNPGLFSNHFDEFQSVFDAAACGVYLGGMDSTFHEDSAPGKIDVFCVFDPSRLSFVWEKDKEGRKVPFMIFKSHKIRINNLHITNKSQIPHFFSLSETL